MHSPTAYTRPPALPGRAGEQQGNRKRLHPEVRGLLPQAAARRLLHLLPTTRPPLILQTPEKPRRRAGRSTRLQRPSITEGIPLDSTRHFHWTTGIDTNVAKTGPHNWFDDNGVDYYDGKVEFRVNVTAKADATPVWHELCHWQNALGDAAHVCLHCLALYTKPGEYTCETTAAQQGGPVDYHKPFVAVQNRVKDGTSGRGTDLTTQKKGLPIDYHYTVVIVPKGQAFSGWASYPLP